MTTIKHCDRCGKEFPTGIGVAFRGYRRRDVVAFDLCPECMEWFDKETKLIWETRKVY